MLDALGIVFCRDECKCEGGCLVIQCSMIYVWMGCRKCARGMRQRVCFMNSVLVVMRGQCGWGGGEQHEVRDCWLCGAMRMKRNINITYETLVGLTRKYH